MSAHTPGLLKYEAAYKTGFVIWGGTNSIPVEIVSSCDDEGRWGAIKDVANARRLVACWNAFDGVPTGTIESHGGIVRGACADLMAQRDSLSAVNADLLAALERIDGMACYASEENTDAKDDVLLMIGTHARAAITKAAALNT